MDLYNGNLTLVSFLLGKVYTFLITMIVKRFVIDVRNLMICISSDFVSEVRSAVGLLVLVYWSGAVSAGVGWIDG